MNELRKNLLERLDKLKINAAVVNMLIEEISNISVSISREQPIMETVSETCRRTLVQNCHVCENMDCGDNLIASDMRRKLAPLIEASKRLLEIEKTIKPYTTIMEAHGTLQEILSILHRP